MSGEASVLTERLVRRDQALIVAALLALTVLAWVWLVGGAGMGMSAAQMTRAALFPHSVAAPAMPGMSPPAASTWGSFALGVAMWWVMMVAMMVPAAAPLILLHARTIRRGQRLGQITAGPVPAAWMLAGYLSVWLVFALVAAALQIGLARAGLVSDMMLWSESRWLSACLLALAAAFQLSPLKRACLSACRAPVAFLSHHWRSGRWGAFRMGFRHGWDCLGCCWALMLLLFVGGVMNLIWIAALGGLVLVERLAPFGARTLAVTAGVLGLWAAVTLFV